MVSNTISRGKDLQKRYEKHEAFFVDTLMFPSNGLL